MNTAERAASASWGPPPSFLESQHLAEAIKESPSTPVGALGCSQSAPSHLLENPHGQRSLADYSPWGCKELGMTDD